MSMTESAGSRSRATGGGVAAGDDTGPRPLHAKSFKLRFAAQREPGRSYVSAVKPRALPATVTDKFYRRVTAAAAEEERERAALQRIEDMFKLGPRDRHPQPQLSSHEYGWWSSHTREWQCRGDRRLQHHIRDSAWLRGRMLVLAADQSLKHR